MAHYKKKKGEDSLENRSMSGKYDTIGKGLGKRNKDPIPTGNKKMSGEKNSGTTGGINKGGKAKKKHNPGKHSYGSGGY